MTREEYQRKINERLKESLELKDYTDIEEKFSSKNLQNSKILMEYYSYLKQRNLCGDILNYICENLEFRKRLVEAIEMDSYVNLCQANSYEDYTQLSLISSDDSMRPIALRTLTNNKIREASISIYKYYREQQKENRQKAK